MTERKAEVAIRQSGVQLAVDRNHRRHGCMFICARVCSSQCKCYLIYFCINRHTKYCYERRGILGGEVRFKFDDSQALRRITWHINWSDCRVEVPVGRFAVGRRVVNRMEIDSFSFFFFLLFFYFFYSWFFFFSSFFLGMQLLCTPCDLLAGWFH